jgi:hypothetical protein
MKLRNSLMTILLGAALGVGAVSTAGCTGSIRGTATYTTTTARPRLVLVQPGVYVVEDYNQSVFFSDGYYWRTMDGRWYRSRAYDDGYVAVRFETIPLRVRRIERPHAYVHFRAGANARVYSRRAHSVRDYRESRHDGRHRH